MPRIGMAVASAGPAGTLNFTALAFLSPNQPLSFGGGIGAARSSL